MDDTRIYFISSRCSASRRLFEEISSNEYKLSEVKKGHSVYIRKQNDQLVIERRKDLDNDSFMSDEFKVQSKQNYISVVEYSLDYVEGEYNSLSRIYNVNCGNSHKNIDQLTVYHFKNSGTLNFDINGIENQINSMFCN